MAAPVHLAAALAALGLACTNLGWDGVIDAQVHIPDDPESGPRFAIERVEDRRVFRASAYNLRDPSLLSPDVDTPERRARAVGRRRGTRGANLWLPEDRTVEGLVSDVVMRALRESGRSVVGSSSAEDVARVEIEILSLWAWMRSSGLGVPRFESEILLRLRAPIPGFEHGVLACGKHRVASNGSSGGVWRRSLEGALDDVVEDLKLQLGTAGEGSPVWRCYPGLQRRLRELATGD